MKLKMLVAMATLLLGACASSGMHGGMVYRDGSWYSPGADGAGDYYTGVEHHHDYYYDWPWAWSVGFVPYGGYCPVMYRYCTSFWADPFYGSGYYYPYVYAYQPWTGQRHRSRLQEDDTTPLARRERRERIRQDPIERRSPRDLDEDIGIGSRRDDGGSPRPRRRAARAGSSPN